MSLQVQLQIVEDNLNEYGQCNITLEEFNFLKEQIRADAIGDFMEKVNERLTRESFTQEALYNNQVIIKCEMLTLDGAVEIVCEVFEELKEQKDE